MSASNASLPSSAEPFLCLGVAAHVAPLARGAAGTEPSEASEAGALVRTIAHNDAAFSFFTRRTGRELALASARSVVARLPPAAQPQVVGIGDCVVCVLASGAPVASDEGGTEARTAYFAVTMAAYPVRATAALLRELRAAFDAAHPDAARSAANGGARDACIAWPPLEAMLERARAAPPPDRIEVVQRQLGETKEVLVRSIEALLRRGESLDALVAKSRDLSVQSRLFYRTARKTRGCGCVVT